MAHGSFFDWAVGKKNNKKKQKKKGCNKKSPRAKRGLERDKKSIAWGKSVKLRWGEKILEIVGIMKRGGWGGCVFEGGGGGVKLKEKHD